MTGQDPFPLLVIVILFSAIVISRIITERALKRLNSEDKARLLDSFSGYRIFNSALLLGVFIIWFVADKYSPHWRSTLTIIFALSFLGVSAAISILSYRKMKGLNLPAGYIKSYLLSLAIQYLGVGFVFIPLLAQTAS
ncbi:MAG: hypothetical protein ACREA2_05305 [Blastocatellia bacterium]